MNSLCVKNSDSDGDSEQDGIGGRAPALTGSDSVHGQFIHKDASKPQHGLTALVCHQRQARRDWPVAFRACLALSESHGATRSEAD